MGQTIECALFNVPGTVISSAISGAWVMMRLDVAGICFSNVGQ
jgi:hypothetical protein